MKNIHLLIALFSFALLASVTPVHAQKRLPDGTIIYGDGSRKLPNGTIVYPNGSKRNTSGANRTIDDILHPNRKYPVNTRVNDNRENLPPGQAKKIYGGSAKDYAPGHNKGNGNLKGRRNNEQDDNENWNRKRDNDHEGRGKGKGHGKKDE